MFFPPDRATRTSSIVPVTISASTGVTSIWQFRRMRMPPRLSRLNVLSAGSRDQNILNRSGDNLRIDWGYFHLAVPKNEDATTVIAPHPAADFVATGMLPESDSIGMPQPANRTTPHLAAVFDLGAVSAAPVKRHLLLAYTEGYAIQFFQRNLRPYWQRNDMPVEELLDVSEDQYSALD